VKRFDANEHMGPSVKDGGSAMDEPDQGGSRRPAIAGLAIAVVDPWTLSAVTSVTALA